MENRSTLLFTVHPIEVDISTTGTIYIKAHDVDGNQYRLLVSPGQLPPLVKTMMDGLIAHRDDEG